MSTGLQVLGGALIGLVLLVCPLPWALWLWLRSSLSTRRWALLLPWGALVVLVLPFELFGRTLNKLIETFQALPHVAPEHRDLIRRAGLTEAFAPPFPVLLTAFVAIYLSTIVLLSVATLIHLTSTRDMDG